jgi:predicted helicase
MVLATDKIADLHVVGAGASSQCFPLYHYVEDKHKKKFERRDNITPKARTLFQIFYDDDRITAADIFHYVYAVLHHPAYRTRFAENLKRDLPRIPFVGQAFQPAGAGDFPVPSSSQRGRPMNTELESSVNRQAGKPALHLPAQFFPLDWRVETMKLTKDKAALIYNDFLTLSGIPPEVFAYKLGNRSALEWVIDQYRTAKDDDGNITSDPNRMDDEEYIVRLIGQVITVSLETMKIVKELPEINLV